MDHELKNDNFQYSFKTIIKRHLSINEYPIQKDNIQMLSQKDQTN